MFKKIKLTLKIMHIHTMFNFFNKDYVTLKGLALIFKVSGLSSLKLIIKH